MRKLKMLALALALPMSGAAALASHLTCNNSSNTPNAGLLGFKFDVQVPISSGGSGGGSSKPMTSLVVQLPLAANYGVLSQMVFNGTHSQRCELDESSGSTVSIAIVMQDVIFSELTLLHGDFYTNNTTGPFVQLTLAYSTITTTTNP